MNDTTPLDTTPLDPTPEPTPRRRFSARPILIGAAAGVVVLGLGVGGFAVADALDGPGDDRVVITSGDRPVTLPGTGATPRPSASNGAVDDNRAISDDEYASVSAAALAAVGGGTVTELKRDDDPGKAWEVEILLANGNEAEVELDAALNVLRIDLDRHDDDAPSGSNSGSNSGPGSNSGSGSDDGGSDDRGGDDHGSGGHGSDD